MKVLRLDLKPFAGFSEKSLNFKPGLNIILGPNDIGKSSIFRALETVLFLPVKISKATKEGKEILPRIIPVGGDHARVCLSFEAKGELLLLEKSWGAAAQIALEKNGNKLIQEEKVEEQLRSLLPTSRAAFQSVLLMGQGALESTINVLEKSREALHSLGDVLRVALDQAGGVSVDRLKARLEREVHDTFSHWDLKTSLPEKGKGIEDPWKKDLGTVLKSFYERELLHRELKKAIEMESARDQLLEEISLKTEQRKEARDFVVRNEKLVEAAREREHVQAFFAKIQEESKALLKDFDSWIKAEAEVKLFFPDVQKFESREKVLNGEFQNALSFAKQKELLTRIQSIKKAGEIVSEARRSLAALPVVKAEDLKRLREAFSQLDRLRNQVKPGKVQVQYHARKDLELAFRKDFDPERRGLMQSGKTMTLNAGNRVQLTSDFFELHVTNGDANLAEIEEALGRSQDRLGNLLAELKVQSLEDAEAKQEAYALAAQALRLAEAALPSEKLEDLEKQVKSVAGDPPREVEVIQMELTSIRGELRQKRELLARSENTLSSLRERYSVSESSALNQLNLEAQTKLREQQKKLSELPAFPPDLGPLEEFLARFRKASADSQSLAEEIAQKKVELADIHARSPERSSQEIERAFREASADFERELERGNALLRVKEAVASVEAASSNLYHEFQQEFEAQVKKFSGGKYQKSSMKEALPSEFHRADGAAIPYSWLSAGTKDSFALVLRLSMAARFLGASNGFVMMDDPLVNMDGDRQKIAAEVLGQFSRDRQVILFTCHAQHASLLGGHLIEL